MADLSPLRRRMIEDMTVRNLSPATQRSYISAVSKFSRYFGRSPDRLELEDVRAFQVHLVSTGISWPALNQIVCALRFFSDTALGLPARDLLPSMQFIVGNARRRCVFCCLDLGRRFQQLARPRIFDDLIRDDLKSRQSSRTETS